MGLDGGGEMSPPCSALQPAEEVRDCGIRQPRLGEKAPFSQVRDGTAHKRATADSLGRGGDQKITMGLDEGGEMSSPCACAAALNHPAEALKPEEEVGNVGYAHLV